MTLTPEKLDEIDRLSKRLLSTGWRAWDAQDVGAAVNALPDLVAAARERDALRARVDELQSLVGRYINHVGECEGCDFLDDSTDWLTEAEREELKDMDVAAQVARAALEGRHE